MNTEINVEDDENDELYMNLVQRLPVATFDYYDPDVPPQNGADYLRRVQLEAKHEPNIKVAPELYFKCDNSFNFELVEENEFIKSLSQFIIPEEIVPSLMESFQKLRQHIEDLRNQKTMDKPIKRSRKWWKEYCLGPQKECGKLKLINYQPRNEYQTNLPGLIILSQITQQQIHRLLNYHYEWLKDDCQFTIERGIWIYSLMAALDLIQTNNTYCLLRQISRLCSHIRNKLEINFDNTLDDQRCMDKLASLNLIILLVGHFFKQKDLLDTWSC